MIVVHYLTFQMPEKAHQPDIKGIEEIHKTKKIILSKFTLKSAKLLIKLWYISKKDHKVRLTFCT